VIKSRIGGGEREREREAKRRQGFGGETRDHVKYVGISETMIRKSTLKKKIEQESVDWVHMAQEQWCAFMNAVVNPSGSIKCGEFFKHLRNCWLPKKDCFMEFDTKLLRTVIR